MGFSQRQSRHGSLANPGSVTFSQSGTFVASLTVTDNNGVTDPSPKTRTITVTAAPPTITSLSATSGPVGTAVTINGTNFGSTQGTSTVTFSRNRGHSDELEFLESLYFSANRSHNGECGGDSGRSGEQRAELHGDNRGSGHHERDDGEWDGRGSVLLSNYSDELADELWSNGIAGGVVREH